MRAFFFGLRPATSPEDTTTVTDIDLTAPEVQAAITAAVEKATGPLIAKRDELLGEVKKLRKNSEIDPAELERVEAERDALKQQLTESKRAAEKASKDLEAATKRLTDTEGAYSNTLRDSALTDELGKAGVSNPVLLKAAKALLAGGLQVVEEGGAKVIKAGDKSLADHVKEWAGSDEGKNFVTAQEASGGGSQGGFRGSTTTKGDMGGSRSERAEAIRSRFPDLPK